MARQSIHEPPATEPRAKLADHDHDTATRESWRTLSAKLNAMFIELYAWLGGASPDPEVNSITVTTTAAVGTDATVAGTLGVTGNATFAGDIAVTGKATAGSAALGTGTKTATAAGGAATLNKASGVITTEALTTAAGADYVLTLTNSGIAAADMVFASIQNGSNSAGKPRLGLVTPGVGSATIRVTNEHATDALNGTLKISFLVLKA